MTDDQAYELPPRLFFEDTGDPTLDYYLELTKITWAGLSPRERKRLHKMNALVYAVMKGLGER